MVLNVTKKWLPVFDLIMHIDGKHRSNGMYKGERERIQTMAPTEGQDVA